MSTAPNKDPAESEHPPGRKKKDPLIGRTINGRFTILEVIARGGMGKVYKAEQAPLGRICALKVLNPKYEGDEDPEFQKRFFLEASTAAKLTHANTVTIFDYGRDEDIYYIAMELIKGRTLYRVLREDGPMEENRVAHVMRQVARSLREAHALGVIHRDMKPANVVLLDEDGGDEPDAVKVLDFGLVKHVDKGEAEDLTQQGLFMGSPKYMAPEQILGNAVSHATDIYSLGVVGYELITGHVPFDRGASVKTLMAHVNDPPPPMHKMNPDVAITPTMHRIIMRCLEKDAKKRYAAIDDLLRDLTHVEGGGALTDSLLSAPAVRPPPSTSGAHRRPDVGYDDDQSETGSSTRPLSHDDDAAIPAAVPVPAPPSFKPSETPRPMSQTALDDADLMPRRSSGAMRAAIAAVAIAAAGAAVFVLGGGDKSDRGEGDNSEIVAGPAAPPVPTETAAVAPTTTALAAHVRTVRITSEPSGAAVKESDEVLCGATPCEITWRGDEATKEHELEFSKRGYATVTETVAIEAEQHSAKLKAAVVQPRPGPGSGPAAPPPPAQPPPPAPEAKPKGLSGYKDSPY